MGLNAVLAGIGGVEGIISGFGASRRLKEAQEARERMLNQIGSDLQTHYQQVQEGNLQALRRTTGLLGDSLRANGSDMGAALARGGVSNSSATAGAIAKNAAANGATIGRMATANLANEENMDAARKDRLDNLRLGYADQDISQARAGAQGVWGGVANLASGLTSLLQPKAAAQETPTFGSGAQAAIDGVPNPGVTTNPMGLNLTSGGGIQPSDATQSNVQTRAAQIGAGVGNPGVSQIGMPLMNGTMNKGLAAPNMNLGGTTFGGYRRLF